MTGTAHRSSVEAMTSLPHDPDASDHLRRDFAAERVEAAWFFDWLSAAPGPAASVLGTSAIRLRGGGIATSMANDPVAYWSKSLGFGSPVDRATIAEIVDFYVAAGTPSATIQIAPVLLPADWPEICAEFALAHGSSWVKLEGEIDAAAREASGLRVAAVGSDDLDEWAHAVFRGFGMPPEHLASIAAESARRGTIQAFGAWHGDSIVAGASLAVVDGVGALLGASTLPEYRGRGAQSALIAIRARAARAAGVTRRIAETGRPSVEGANPSLNNLVRAGLAPVYDRVNWEWTNPSW